VIKLNWAEFKVLIDKNHVRARYVEFPDAYEIYGSDQGLVFDCRVVDGEDDFTEFENSYKAAIDQQLVGSVTTATEVDYLVLKMAKVKGQADANGDLVLSVMVPGSVANVERYAAGGYAFTDNYSWEDAITKVEVVDVDGVTGYPAGTVLKEYHDGDMDAENHGWYFWKGQGSSEGECEIEPIGWYGQINGELQLKITFKVAANAKVKANIWWGAKD
jgi:hypothetical protein